MVAALGVQSEQSSLVAALGAENARLRRHRDGLLREVELLRQALRHARDQHDCLAEGWSETAGQRDALAAGGGQEAAPEPPAAGGAGEEIGW